MRWLLRVSALTGAACVLWSVVAALTVLDNPLTLAIAVAGPLPSWLVGVFAWRLVPPHPVARQALAVGVLFAMLTAVAFLAAAAGNAFDFVQLPRIWRVLIGGIAAVLVVTAVRLVGLLPDGRYRFAYEKAVLRALWLVVPFALVLTFAGGPLPVSPIPLGMWLLVLGPVLLAARYFLLPRAQRRLLRWLLGMAVLVGTAVLAPLVLASRLVPGSTGQLAPILVLLATVAVPVALAVAAFRYRMLGVEVRRSTRYRLLWLLIALWYLGVVAGLSLAASRFLSLWPAMLVTVAAALAVLPIRARLSRAASLRVFGRRPSSYELLVHLGGTLEQAFDLPALADQLAGGLREALDLRWARVRLQPPEQSVVATAGEPPPSATARLEAALRHGGDRLGLIECGPKTEGEFTAADEELVTTLARQSALAVHNVGLSAELLARLDQIERQAGELEASRARIVHAQSSERRRIQRRLHDGIQQELIVLLTTLGLARDQLRRDPGHVDPALDAAQEALCRVIDEVREAAHRIHPAELTDQGLAAAVESRARRMPIPVAVDADPEVRAARFAVDLEETAYFIVSEALANVLKHARATQVTMRLSLEAGELCLEIRDNGCGFPSDSTDGSGLAGLRDRADTVGGRLTIVSLPDSGTTVRAQLPVRESEPVPGWIP
ncbi:sensor histidine kinase [Amycolatopsis circi]|uniref:sensor histidine kinase n=1 Tax=Amycolatopsis circi TaxID=871959 RepID=UPI000E251724|nr:sensor histidine kinase [Amycolatopsis circi]